MTQLFNGNFMGQTGNQALNSAATVPSWVNVANRNVVSVTPGEPGYLPGSIPATVELLDLPSLQSTGQDYGELVNLMSTNFDIFKSDINQLRTNTDNLAFVPNQANIAYLTPIVSRTLETFEKLEDSLESYQTALWNNLLSEADKLEEIDAGFFNWEEGLTFTTITAVVAAAFGSVLTAALPVTGALTGFAAAFVASNLAAGLIPEKAEEALGTDPEALPNSLIDPEDIFAVEEFVARLVSDTLEAQVDYDAEFPGIFQIFLVGYSQYARTVEAEYIDVAEEFADLAATVALRTMLQGVMQGSWTFDPEFARELGFNVSVEASGGLFVDEITWTVSSGTGSEEKNYVDLPSSITFTEETRRITNVERSLEHFGPNGNDASSGLKDSQWYADILAKGGDLSGVVPGTSPEGTPIDPYKTKDWEMADTIVNDDDGQVTLGTTFQGTSLHDKIDGTAIDDIVLAQSGEDTIYGLEGNDSLDGGSGNDFLTGQIGDDTLLGQDGNDLLVGGYGNDMIYGHAGTDMIFADAGDDVVSGGNDEDYVHGGYGNDHLSGGAGNDTLDGGAGNDTLDGGAGNDRLDGGAGIDIISTGGGNDIVYGGDGDDHVTIDGFSRSKVYGQGGNDSIMGSNGRQVLDGGAGNDTINGGDDWITADVDILFGGAGDDLLISGQTDTPRDAKSQKNGDKLYGQDGHDTLQGGKADDLLDGGAGNDTLDGGAGNDTLDGGAGNDILNGGNGSDVYVFSDDFGQDLIQSFQMFGSARDVIDLSGVSTITNYIDLVHNHLSSTPVFGSWWHPTTFDIEIDDGQGNSISVTGTPLPQLTPDNFIF